MDDFNYKGHLTIGTAFGAAYSGYLRPEYFLLFDYPQFWIGVMLGSLIPDLDHQSSVINQKILFIKHKWFQKIVYAGAGLAAMMYYGFSANSIVFAVTIALIAFSSHRKFTHGIIGLLMISGAIFFCLGTTSLTIGLFVGIISHIAADKFHDVVFS